MKEVGLFEKANYNVGFPEHDKNLAVTMSVGLSVALSDAIEVAIDASITVAMEVIEIVTSA